MKVLPLLSKQLDLCVSRMTTSNGGPVPSRRRKNSVFSYYFSVKYIDTQIKYLFSCLFLFSLVFVFETIVQSFRLRITWENPPQFPQLYTSTVPGELLYRVLYGEAAVQGPTPYPIASHTIQKWYPFEIPTNCKSFCQFK